jgi:hypothetical protein
MRIGLFGFFHIGNFGDDLMAVLVAQHLSKQGHDILVHGLHEQVASEFALTTTDSIEELVKWSDCIVYAGGGAFLGRSNASSFSKFDRQLDSLLSIAAQLKKEVLGISLGGDERRTFNAARRRLLEEATYISFRNPEDKELADLRTGPSDIFPDVVWCTPLMLDCAGTPGRSDRPFRILIDIAGGSRWKVFGKKCLYTIFKLACTFRQRPTVVEFVNLNLRRSLQCSMPNRGSRILYTSLREVLKAIRDCDLILAW